MATSAAATAVPIAKKIALTRADLVALLSTPEFYMEFMVVCLSIVLAWLVGVLIRRRAAAHLEAHPPKRLSAEFIMKALTLLPTGLLIVYLEVLSPMVHQYSSGDFVEGVFKLAVAYFLAKTVMMVVKARHVAYLIATIIMLIAVLRATGFLHDTLDYLRSTDFEIGKFKLSALQGIHGIVILIVVFWLAGTTSNTLENTLRKRSNLNYNTRELIVKFSRIFMYFIALMITLSVMGVDLTAFAVFGGALGVGIGLGLQKLTASFLSGITLLLEKSIKIGDLIEVGGATGRIRQLNIRYALMDTQDGRELLIPNDELLSSRVTNWTYSSNKARVDVPTGIDYANDPELAQKLMLEAAREYKGCLKDPAPSCLLTGFGEAGFTFRLSFWINDVKDGKLGPQSEVLFNVVRKFREAGITIRMKQFT